MKVCEKCGVEIERDGNRGRFPKYCQNCRRQRGPEYFEYQRKFVRLRKSILTEQLCPTCSSPLTQHQVDAGATYCSHSCYGVTRQTLIGTTKVCVICGGDFEPTYKDQKCCNAGCARVESDRNKRQRAKLLSDVTKSCVRCSKDFHPGFYNATQQIYCQDCIAFQDRDKCRRRRAKIRSVEADRINDYEVFERDGWICKLCNEPINRAATWPDLASASIDHVVPLSKGGTHTLDNVQAAHLGCNMSKGNREEIKAGLELA